MATYDIQMQIGKDDDGKDIDLKDILFKKEGVEMMADALLYQVLTMDGVPPHATTAEFNPETRVLTISVDGDALTENPEGEGGPFEQEYAKLRERVRVCAVTLSGTDPEWRTLAKEQAAFDDIRERGRQQILTPALVRDVYRATCIPM